MRALSIDRVEFGTARVLGAEDVHALMIFEPGGYEPEAMRRLMQIIDVVPARRPRARQ